MRSDVPVLVLLPHPDDEFAVMPFLQQAAVAGRALHLVWLTDGGAGEAAPARRAQESLDALASAGVRCASCRFLGMEAGLPDGRLHQHLGRARTALAELVAPFNAAFELWLPAWEGGHQDHDAAHALGLAVARGTSAVLLQYPVYRSADRWGVAFTVLSPLRAMRVRRRARPGIGATLALLALCLRYRSQWRSFLGLLPVMAMRLLVLRRPMVLCDVDASAVLDRPHAGVLLYERRTAWRWRDLQSAIEGLGA